MTVEILNLLDNLDQRFNAIKEQASKYFDHKSTLRKDGAAAVFNRPWIGPLNFGIVVFPPIDKNWLKIFEEKTGFQIPSLYQDILLKMNGCRIYDFNLYGLPKSTYLNELLDRTIVQQLSLESANTLWRNEFKIDESYFYIGGRRFNENENLGYFLKGQEIVSIRKDGTIINSWISFQCFLEDEIIIVENYMLQSKPV